MIGQPGRRTIIAEVDIAICDFIELKAVCIIKMHFFYFQTLDILDLLRL